MCMNVCAIYIHGMGVQMCIIGVHTRVNKIRVRRDKVRACGRPALQRTESKIMALFRNYHYSKNDMYTLFSMQWYLFYQTL